MAKIRIVGDASGYVELSAQNAAGNNTLELPSGSTKLVGSDNSGNIVVGVVTATSIAGVTTAGITTAYIGAINDGPISGARNRIINGDFRIDQRNAGVSTTPTNGAYTLDRWQAALSQTSKFTVQQSGTTAVGFTSSLLVTSSSAYTVGASESFRVQQNIEGFNISDLAWGTANAKPVTLSFWVRSSLTGTFGGSVLDSLTTYSYPFSYTISSANTFEYKTITIPGPTSGGTWGTTNGVGMLLNFSLGSGSSVSGTAGSWASATYTSSTGATSVVGTNGATWYITGVQLEAGTTATAFERRSYGQELALCQRYACVFGGSVVNQQIGQGRTSDATTIELFIPLPVTMRSQALSSSVIGSVGNFSCNDNAVQNAATSVTILSIGDPNVAFFNIGTTGMTASRPARVMTGTVGTKLLISAEL